MNWIGLVVPLVAGALAGALSGFLGLGGGAILTPMLALGLGFEQHRAQGVALAALLPPVTLPAVLAYRRLGARIDLKLVGLLVAGFAVGGVGGAQLAQWLPGRELRWLFCAYLLVAAVRALWGGRAVEDDAEPRPVRLAWGVPVGIAAGVASGLLGIGGGIVALPLLRRLAGLDRLSAQATTLAMFLPPIGLPALLVYVRESGALPWGTLGLIVIGFVAGSLVGARLAGRVDAHRAARAQAWLLILISALMLAR